MPHVHVSRFEARSYELDSYRHLNNGVYLAWLEHARLQFLQSLGFSYDGFADRQQWIVVARAEVDFRAPLHAGDTIELSTEVVSTGRSSVRFRQVMRRMSNGAPEAAPACEALTVMVFSGPTGRSVPIPDDFRAALGSVPA
jgi:YbgC/YbaW family acyl-CoA thioester hydrolase